METLRERQHVSIAEALKITGLSRSTISRAVRTGALPTYATGAGTVRPRVRIAVSDIAAWLTPRPVLRARVERHDPERARTTRGFTLLELLVVVIIIGILSGIAVPVFLNQKAKAYDASVKSDLKSTMLQAETFAAGEGGYPVTAADWAAKASSGNTIRAFSAGGQGYVVYGQNAAAKRIWAASSWDGGAPCRTTLTALPDVVATATGCPFVPAGFTSSNWSAVGGSTWGLLQGRLTPGEW